MMSLRRRRRLRRRERIRRVIKPSRRRARGSPHRRLARPHHLLATHPLRLRRQLQPREKNEDAMMRRKNLCWQVRAPALKSRTGEVMPTDVSMDSFAKCSTEISV